jgi:hypothetical protein
MTDNATHDIAGDETTARCEALVDALIQDWRTSNEPMPGAPDGPGEPGRQRAYLLFNRWEDNALAQALEKQFPRWARDRVSVPDSHFEHREDSAPCLLELPEELAMPSLGFKSRDLRAWLVGCVDSAARQANERLTKQDFCCVVISPESERTITRHWVGLGHQQAAVGEDSLLFRYQDPRVMQRVWPSLSPLQQSRWLGPVGHWWSLAQPWGPFRDVHPSPQWFCAKAPVLPHGMVPGGSPRNLFDQDQWFVSGISPQANRVWRSYAEHHIPRAAQPDPERLLHMLADAARMKLDDLDLEDYVWITWMHAPKEGAPRAIDWRLPHLAPILSRIRDQLRDQPDARFSSLFAKATQPRR